jgi:hypothetical protein
MEIRSMKIKTGMITATLIIATLGANAAITVGTSSNNGGSTLGLDISIGSDKTATSTSTEFTVDGEATTAAAIGATVGLTVDAIKNVSTNAATRGDKLTDGSFNTDAGVLGVYLNPNAGGIGNDASGDREGIQIAFDDLSDVNPSVTLQVTHIKVLNVFNAGESFFVVNLATRDYLEFTAGSAGDFDVSSLNITISGGDSGPVATLYSGDIGGFRFGGITFDLTGGENTLLAPANLDAVATNNAQIQLDWWQGSLADSYNIYRSTNSGSYGSPIETNITSTSYVDTNVTNHTTYYYVVTSVSNNTESATASPEVSVYPFDTSDSIAPATPSGLSVALTNSIKALLNWDDNTESDLHVYTVYRSTTSGSYSSPLAENLTESNYADDDLEIGTAYYYTVTASDYASNESGSSAEMGVTPVTPSGEVNLYFVLETGDIYGFSSISGSGASCMEQRTVELGIPVATSQNYGSFQGFTATPNGKIYGINEDGDVIEWPSASDWIAGNNALTLSTGNYDPSTTNRIHGVSYDPNTEGFFVVYESPGSSPDGDIGEYDDLAALTNNTPSLISLGGYGANICNFTYGSDDTINNVSDYTNSTGAIYFQINSIGQIFGFQTLEDYITGDSTRTYQQSGFTSVVGAFYSFNPEIGTSSISYSDNGNIIIGSQVTKDATYTLQGKTNLTSGAWSNLLTGIEDADGILSITTTPANAQGFYRIISE